MYRSGAMLKLDLNDKIGMVADPLSRKRETNGAVPSDDLLQATEAVDDHKYYVSVTVATWSKSNTLQLVTRLFIDDVQRVLNERYDLNLKLDGTEDQEQLEKLLDRYTRQTVTVQLNGQTKALTSYGYKVENDQYVLFYETEALDRDLERVTIKNRMMMGVFSDQQNMVNVVVGKQRKSLLLTTDDDENSLTFD